MVRLEPFPSAIKRFHEIGGVVEFAIFDDADGDPDAVFQTICSSAPIENPAALRAIGFSKIDDNAFYGDWYEAETESLLLVGDYVFEGDRKLSNPRLRDLDGLKLLRGGASIPDHGGQFAYAFSHPPYGLRASGSEIQQLFDKIRHVILPAGVDHEILDWSNGELSKAGAYFQMGLEWWGVFLFSIYVPSSRRLTIAWASTTD